MRFVPLFPLVFILSNAVHALKIAASTILVRGLVAVARSDQSNDGVIIRRRQSSDQLNNHLIRRKCFFQNLNFHDFQTTMNQSHISHL